MSVVCCLLSVVCQYHCPGCGICRVGGAANFFHCDKCCGCFPHSEVARHTSCVADAMKSTCPVCLEDLFSSTSNAIRLRCGHVLHSKCYGQLLRSTYKCPLCSQSLADMSAAFADLDREIAMTPMPAEYATTRKQVLCNDCHGVRSPCIGLPFATAECRHFLCAICPIVVCCLRGQTRSQETSTLFHVLGLKCMACGSYNTREIRDTSVGEPGTSS